MGSTLGKRWTKPALCLLAALFVALMLTVGAVFESALADDAQDSSLAAGESSLSAAADVETYPLWIGETQVTSDNLSGPGWSFDPTAKTLKLDGFSYEGVGHYEYTVDASGSLTYRHSPVFWNDSNNVLAIALEGENSITVPVAGSILPDHGMDYYYGVFSAGDLTFKGDGILIADAGGLEGGSDDDLPEAAGIHVGAALKIEGGSILATGYNSGIESEYGTITIGADAGSITAKTTGPTTSSPYAIYTPRGSVRIDDGTVTAIGYTGIYTAEGLVVNGGNIVAQSNVADTYGGSIMTPSGIYSENGQVIINEGSVYAKGFNYGIYSGYSHDDDDDDEPVANGIVVDGGSVIAESTGSDSKNIGYYGIRVAGEGGGTLTVSGGSVQTIASGKDGIGVSAPGSVTIGEKITSFVATGTVSAFASDTSVKNAVAGIGWTNTEGTEGKKAIELNTAGQTLDSYKKALFPAATASVLTPPSGKELTYSGESQQLVTAGEAYGGEMQYSLDGETFSAELPTAINAGEYTIYYKVVGDESHFDSEVMTVTSTITATSASTSSAARKADTSKSSTAKTGDSMNYAALIGVTIVALLAVAVVIAIAIRRRMRN